LRVYDLSFLGWGSQMGFRVYEFGIRSLGLGLKCQGLEFRVESSKFRLRLRFGIKGRGLGFYGVYCLKCFLIYGLGKCCLGFRV